MPSQALDFGFVANTMTFGTKSNPLISNESAPIKADLVRVFCVEDDSLLRMLLSTKFDMSSVTYDFSEDGLNIPDKLRQFKPNVILLDIMIGSINGLDVLEEVKACSDLATIPVIVFSNQDSYEERHRATELGANSYLVKATTDLSDLVKLLLGVSSK